VAHFRIEFNAVRVFAPQLQLLCVRIGKCLLVRRLEGGSFSNKMTESSQVRDDDFTRDMLCVNVYRVGHSCLTRVSRDINRV
jgi:hypothetical protein